MRILCITSTLDSRSSTSGSDAQSLGGHVGSLFDGHLADYVSSASLARKTKLCKPQYTDIHVYLGKRR